jgi:NAD(P)-dependent dehydrogenase (short-subunit alcohol dehydrogenase family)
LFAEAGAAVALVDCNAETGREAAGAIAAAGARSVFVHADVSSRADAERAVATARDTFGGIDVLVNNAGILRYGTAADTSDEIWDQVMGVNVRAVFLMCRAALPALIARGGGAIVTVGSVQSLGTVANSAAYITSKHAVLGLVRSIATDFARHGIRSNCVCPGAIDTPMQHWGVAQARDPEAALRANAAIHLLRRLGSPDEVARVILFLAGSGSSFMTGQAVCVDGGAMLPVGGASLVHGGPEAPQ